MNFDTPDPWANFSRLRYDYNFFLSSWWFLLVFSFAAFPGPTHRTDCIQFTMTINTLLRVVRKRGTSYVSLSFCRSVSVLWAYEIWIMRFAHHRDTKCNKSYWIQQRHQQKQQKQQPQRQEQRKERKNHIVAFQFPLSSTPKINMVALFNYICANLIPSFGMSLSGFKIEMQAENIDQSKAHGLSDETHCRQNHSIDGTYQSNDLDVRIVYCWRIFSSKFSQLYA